VRFPLSGSFGGVVFFDSGNVWADWRSIDFNLKNGVGLGARYLSPIGPIRAGIGWKLDREKGEKGFALFVNIGNPFWGREGQQGPQGTESLASLESLGSLFPGAAKY